MRNNAILAVSLAALLAAALQAPAARAGTAAEAGPNRVPNPAPHPSSAQVYFIWPQDGTVITGGKFWLRMGLRNMGIAPKGADVPNTGHHHVLVDTELPPMTEPIPNDRKHLHFGAGETEARIELPPGKHTLQLLLGDKDHVPHKPPVVSKKITVTVR
ncbi:MAG: hypothetical protein V7631_1085 [Massilia sp.]|jgi:hypothetical protein